MVMGVSCIMALRQLGDCSNAVVTSLEIRPKEIEKSTNQLKSAEPKRGFVSCFILTKKLPVVTVWQQRYSLDHLMQQQTRKSRCSYKQVFTSPVLVTRHAPFLPRSTLSCSTLAGNDLSRLLPALYRLHCPPSNPCLAKWYPCFSHPIPFRHTPWHNAPPCPSQSDWVCPNPKE